MNYKNILITGTMLPVCLPVLSFNTLVPLVLAWAWFSVQLLPDLMVNRDQ